MPIPLPPHTVVAEAINQPVSLSLSCRVLRDTDTILILSVHHPSVNLTRRLPPQNSAATADVGGWACVEALGEGVPEYEVALAGTAAMTRRIAEIYPNSELMDSGWPLNINLLAFIIKKNNTEYI